MTTNPYEPTAVKVSDPSNPEFEYAGFWVRAGATLIDSILVIAITYPILYAIYGSAYFGEENTNVLSGPADFLVSYVFPAVGSIVFWLTKQGTPGKLALSLRVVDANTGNSLTIGQSIGRYLGYFVSTLPLGLGFFWVAFDSRKQSWHDKMANSVVVRATSSATQPVIFDQRD